MTATLRAQGGPCTMVYAMVRALLTAAFAAIVVAASSLCAPEQALALFNQTTDSNPAAQDLGSYGDPIYASQLPEGAYQVTARTSSRMCVLYTDPAHAEARTSKEQAIVLVDGDSMTAVFYISSAYTHLFWGNQDEAAAATNEDGTDASAYIAGDPDEGYVPHMFALSIPALNTPLTISAYNGGDHGLEEGVWWTRQVVFGMTDAEFQAAVQSAQEPADDQPTSEEPTDTGDGAESQGSEDTSDSGSGDDADPGDEGAADGDGVQDEQEGTDAADGDDGEDEEVQEPESNGDGSADSSVESGDADDAPAEQVALTADNVSASDAGGDGEQGGAGQNYEEPDIQSEGPDQQSDEIASKGAAPAPRKTLRGVRMNVVNSEVTVDVDAAGDAAAPEEENRVLSPRQMLALALAGAFALGVALRIIWFFLGYECMAGVGTAPPIEVSP